uniref:Uncharacterized protein n=1 Tax=Phytophthora ramorum TaxID=164328 RepID=H3GHY7_PHYRM
MAFQARWRELKRVGWTSTLPAGLSNDFFDIKPGKTKQGTRDEDYFVGENKLMDFLDRVDIDHSKDLDQTQSRAPLERTPPAAANSPAYPVSNNILIATSPHVMDEDSSGRSTRQEDLDANNDTNDSDSNYEDSERGSNDDEAGVVRSSHNKEEETKEGDSQLGGALTNDPSITTLGDNLAAYTALDSDGDGEGDSIYSDDDDLDWATLDVDDAHNAPDLHFDLQLLTAVGGFDQMNGSAKTIRVLMTALMGALQAAPTPLGVFLRFATPQLLAKIGRESDTYFTENLDARVEAQHAKQQARKLKRLDFQVQAPEQIKTKLQKP